MLMGSRQQQQTAANMDMRVIQAMQCTEITLATAIMSCTYASCMRLECPAAGQRLSSQGQQALDNATCAGKAVSNQLSRADDYKRMPVSLQQVITS